MRTRMTGRWLAGTAAGTTVAALLAVPATAQAAGTESCVGSTCTVTFAYTGALDAWTAPAGVTSATFDVYGAQGGKGGGIFQNGGSGGRGAHVSAGLPVTAQETYTITVGGTPAGAVGGYNGGGSVVGCCGIAITAGPGGGASDVADGTGSLLLVAAGGGGGGGCGLEGHASSCGAVGGAGGDGSGAAGAPGSDSPVSSTVTGGRGGGGAVGTVGAGGAGGAGSLADGGPGGDGSGRTGGQGGTGSGMAGFGGGGGGGFHGGGGGGGGGRSFENQDPGFVEATGGGGGGGGGSSMLAAGVTGTQVSGARSGHGQVVITYTKPAVYTFGGFLSPVDNPPTVNSGKAGRVYPVKFVVTDSTGAKVTSTQGITATTRSVSCGSLGGAPADALETTATTTAPLRYDSAGGYFIVNWKSPSAAGCYTLTITTPDGSQHPAHFNLSG